MWGEKFDETFFVANGYQTTRVANKILEELWEKKADIKTLKEYLGKKIDELNDFIENSVDYLKLKSTAYGFLEELKWEIKDIDFKAGIIAEKCASLYDNGEMQCLGRENPQHAFSELNELLFERTKILAERVRLESEQMWTSLLTKVKDELEKGNFSKVGELTTNAKDSFNGIGINENNEEKRQIVEEVEAMLLEALQCGQLMERYANDIDKLKELRDMSIVINKGILFFSLCVSPLRMKIENLWKEGYTYKNTHNNAIIRYVDYINDFFEKSLNSISDEIKRIESVASNHETLASMSILDVFCGLSPSFTRRFNTYVYSSGNLSIKNVEKLYDACESFSLKLEKIIKDFVHEESNIEHLISSRTFCNYSESLFGYFLENQEDLVESELIALNNFAQNISITIAEKRLENEKQNNSLDCNMYVEKLFNEINSCISRCIKISQGISLCLLIPRLDSVVESAFINILYTLYNFTQPETSPPLKRISSNKNLDSLMLIYKQRNNVDNRCQFIELINNLSLCKKFYLYITEISNTLANTRVLNPRYPNPSFQETKAIHDVSITGSYIIYKQTVLLEKTLDLRKLIATNIHMWIENTNSLSTYSKITSALFESCSNTISSMAKFCQESLLENILKPIEHQFQSIGSVSDENMENTDWQLDENAESFTSQAATQIAEHLLTLPLILDPYLEGNSLNFSLETLPGNNDILKDFKFPTDAVKLEEDRVGYEDYTLARWIRAVLILATEKFEQLGANNIAIAAKNPRVFSQLKADVEYLDKIVSSLDIGIVRSFTKVVEKVKQSLNDG